MVTSLLDEPMTQSIRVRTTLRIIEATEGRIE
jgi:hypothetical protein